MIRLRLQRKGRKRRPYYHIVAADQRSPRDGRVIERLGRYDNVSEKKQLTLDEERVIHWLRVGAQPSDTVRSLLKGEGILYKLHLIRWGKSEEEIEQALAEWREARSARQDDDEDSVSRKEREKALLEAEEKEYKKRLEEKAAEAARQAKVKEAEKEQEEAAAETEESEEKAAADSGEDEASAKAGEVAEEKAEATPSEEPEAEEKKTEGETAAADTEAEEPEKAKSDDQAAAETAEGEDETTSDDDEAPPRLSTDMNANEAIDHIKNTPLEELKGFVPEDEDRVTVQRAWESKQSE